MNPLFPLLFLGGGAGILVLIVLFWIRLLRLERWRRTQDIGLRNDVVALCRGANGLSHRITRLEQQLKQISERQERVEMREPEDRSYTHAVKLVQKGATIDDLTNTCGLTRTEAELVIMLHGSHKQYSQQNDARVAELVDALDLGSSGATRESSSLSFRTHLDED